jgi:hypothetical protein
MPGGFRMPTIKELETIINDHAHGPAIDLRTFPDTPSDDDSCYWSASNVVPSSSTKWYLPAVDGRTWFKETGTTELCHVRCVK